MPQIEYEDKVVEVPVQKHVQATLTARVLSYFKNFQDILMGPVAFFNLCHLK